MARKNIPYEPFKTKKLDKEATAVIATQEFYSSGVVIKDEKSGTFGGKKRQPIITIFMGSKAGKPEAQRLVSMLNEAWKKFHQE